MTVRIRRRSRISLSGLHQFVRDEVAKREGTDSRYCQIVDVHYFRGRLRAAEADSRDVLYKERVFDDVLIREGVTTHYLPFGQQQGEKGVDVWLALEAFELTIFKRFNVVVLVACDGDFLPLVRKLNTIGARVMVLAWDFKFVDHSGNERETRTSQALLDEVTYPVMMHQIIDDRARKGDSLITGLFVPRKEFAMPIPSHEPFSPAPQQEEKLAGTVKKIMKGYGFIVPDAGGPDVFFYYLDTVDVDFLDLKPGEKVEFAMGRNDKGPCAKQVRRIT